MSMKDKPDHGAGQGDTPNGPVKGKAYAQVNGHKNGHANGQATDDHSNGTGHKNRVQAFIDPKGNGIGIHPDPLPSVSLDPLATIGNFSGVASEEFLVDAAIFLPDSPEKGELLDTIEKVLGTEGFDSPLCADLIRLLLRMKSEGLPLDPFEIEEGIKKSSIKLFADYRECIPTLHASGGRDSDPYARQRAIQIVLDYSEKREASRRISDLANRLRVLADHAEKGLDPNWALDDCFDQLSELAVEVKEAVRPRSCRRKQYSKIKPDSIKFLCDGRFVSNDLNSIAALPGTGKGLITAYLGAQVSRGAMFHGEGEADPDRRPGDVLVISAEDGDSTAISPRYRAAGADMDRISGLNDQDFAAFHLGRIDILDRYRREIPDLKLIIIDPPAAFLDGVKENENAAVRSILTPLSLWCRKHEIAVLFTTHCPKGRVKNGSGVIIGSQAWNAAPRANWMAAKAEEDDNRGRRILAIVKANDFDPAPAIYYTIEKVELEELDSKGKPIKTARIVWGDLVELNADDIVEAQNSDIKPGGARRGPEPDKTSKIATWIWESLQDGPVLLKDMFTRAADQGYMKKPTNEQPKPSAATLYEAIKMIPRQYPGYEVATVPIRDERYGNERKQWILVPTPPKPQMMSETEQPLLS